MLIEIRGEPARRAAMEPMFAETERLVAETYASLARLVDAAELPRPCARARRRTGVATAMRCHKSTCGR
jgi:hypothetical protein